MDIERGQLRLRFFTIRNTDFHSCAPRPPWRYSLVTQVFTADGEYQCAQLLGIDLRAIKTSERQGCPFLSPVDIAPEDQHRIEQSLGAYAKFVVGKLLEKIQW